MKTSELITNVLTAAALEHSTPVVPESLLNMKLSAEAQYLRARLNSIACYHLTHNHKIPVDTVCKAYRLDRNTVTSRIKIGKKLSRKSPWKKTYLSLP